jgi:hypothetical protein
MTTPIPNVPMRGRIRLVALALYAVAPLNVASAQQPVADPADVGTIADIVRVSYEVISGPAGTPRQWRRDSTLYMPGATFVSVTEADGRVQSTIMTPEEYRQRSGHQVEHGMFETEIGRRIERWGHVAQVRSVAVVRRTPEGPIEERYVNYFQLYWDGTRWWIAGMVWDKERPNAPIPASWIGRFEEVSADSAFAELQERGRAAMGVDQYTSTHRFDALSDGGRIELQRDVDDPDGIATIRKHLQEIVTAFRQGDFGIPGLVHAQQVPGTAVMARKKDMITYTYSELPRGGQIRLTTSDHEALHAIHDFIAFQRSDHRAGGHEH